MSFLIKQRRVHPLLPGIIEKATANVAITGCDLRGRTVAAMAGTAPTAFAQTANVEV